MTMCEFAAAFAPCKRQIAQARPKAVCEPCKQFVPVIQFTLKLAHALATAQF
jgi:hypothetical protein